HGTTCLSVDRNDVLPRLTQFRGLRPVAQGARERTIRTGGALPADRAFVVHPGWTGRLGRRFAGRGGHTLVKPRGVSGNGTIVHARSDGGADTTVGTGSPRWSKARRSPLPERRGVSQRHLL